MNTDKVGEYPGTSQADYYALAERNFSGAGLGGYSLPEEVRFIVERGVGSRLQSLEGRWYIDYVGALEAACNTIIWMEIKTRGQRSIR